MVSLENGSSGEILNIDQVARTPKDINLHLWLWEGFEMDSYIKCCECHHGVYPRDDRSINLASGHQAEDDFLLTIS